MERDPWHSLQTVLAECRLEKGIKIHERIRVEVQPCCLLSS